MPRSQREKQFRQCVLYDMHPEFFEANFAKYPVIMLDLKTSCPMSFEDAPSYLRNAVLTATSKYTRLLCKLLNGVDSGYEHLGLDKDIIEEEQDEIKGFLDEVNYVKEIGVFDVRCVGLGSGLNNVESYMAHSGFAGTRLTENPFQLAFRFTIHDVWGLINDYVDNRWPYRVTTTRLELGRFKRDLLVGCIQYFDGYRIGQVHHVFNPYAILSLICELGSIKSLADVDYSSYTFWTDTGSMKVVEMIKASSAQDLRRYCEYLSSSFLRQSEYRQHQGLLAEHMLLDFIDDAAVGSIGNQEQPQFSPDIDKETGEELADICMIRSGDRFHDMQSLGREPFQASTVMHLLYQAGYIVPIAKDRVGIPNSEVHMALEQFYERVATQLKISTNLLESIHEQMGIYKCDL
ncbi:hypothetical protein IW138_005737 [Coemansia sp. RSA 986]|nr:hypothetical protein IW138_005737 [Coemansia sp. RSA 986]